MTARTSAALALLVGTALLPWHGARADGVPRFLPDRDVRVAYTVRVPGRPAHDYALAFSAESEQLRIDDAARGLWFLADLRDAHAALVVPRLHVVVSEPDLAGLAAMLQSLRAARFTPVGRATIAGLGCTRYRVAGREANGTACLTREGIALAVSGRDARGSAEAIADSVTETAVPASTFALSPGYSTLTLPRGVVAALLGN